MFRSLDDQIADNQRVPQRELISSEDVPMFRSLEDLIPPRVETEEEKAAQAVMHPRGALTD